MNSLQCFGKNVLIARTGCKWTQDELAHRSGMSRSTIGKIETNNASDISLGKIDSIAKAFGVPPYIFFMNTDDWNNIDSLLTLPDRIKHADLKLTSEELDELVKQSKSKNPESSTPGATEKMQRIADEIIHGSNLNQSDEVMTPVAEKNITDLASVAIAVANLPARPILNVLMAKILAPLIKL